MGQYRQLVTDQFGNVQWDRITTSGVDFSNIQGPVTINGAFTVNGNTALNGNLDVAGAIDVVGGIITSGLIVNGGSNLNGPVNVNGPLNANNGINLTGGGINGLFPHVHYPVAATIASGDANKVVIMQPDSYYTVSIAAPSSYTDTTFFILVNSSNIRGKRISPSGQTSFILWPRQAIYIQNIDGVWVYQTSRWAPPGNVTFFIDNIAGDDSSDGLDSSGVGPGCFKTVQHGYDTILSVIDPQQPISTTIQLPTNTGSNPIDELPSLAGMSMTSTFNVNIVGNPGNASLCSWFLPVGGPNPMITIADWATISFNGISFGVTTGTVPALVQCRQLCIADFRNCNFANDIGGVAVKILDNGRMNLIGPIGIEGNYSAFIQILYEGSMDCALCNFHLLLDTNVGTFVNIIGSGSVNLTNITFDGDIAGMGGSRYNLNGPCCVITANSVTWPPALTPGVTANGGVEI